MVKIKRVGLPPCLARTNKQFKEKIKGKSKEEAYIFYNQNKGVYRYNTEETKKKFRKMNYQRCSFCTKFISDFEVEMTVEHIRTKRENPEKIYQWNNLLCSCRTCNTERGIRKYEKEMYLDPTKVEDIEEYFWFELDGTMGINMDLDEDKQKKAQYMIDIYKLYRKDLVCERRNFLKKMIEDKCFFENLKKEDFSSPYIIILALFTYYRRCIE